MKIKRTAWALLVVLGACATPASRIRKNQAAFDAYPPAVQELIRKGEVAPGFTREQATLALGEPDRRFKRGAASEIIEVWSYRQFSVRPSLSIGGSWGGGGQSAAGASIEQAQAAPDEQLRLVFTDGLVSSVERPSR